MNNTQKKSTYHAVAGGHLHAHWCGHRNQTQWAAGHVGKSKVSHMVELDGMNQNEVVAKYGASCCSHCMPAAPSGTKMTQAQIDDLNGTTARRAALAAKLDALANAHTPELDALIVAFYTADDAGDYDTAAEFYPQMIKLAPEGYSCADRARQIMKTKNK